MTAPKITFTLQRAIKRDGIKVGRIYDDPAHDGRWKIIWTPASGFSESKRWGGRYERLRDAKAAAVKILTEEV